MQNPATRAKTFVNDHRGKIGIAAGISAGVFIGKNLPIVKDNVVITATTEMLQQLIDDPRLEIACADTAYDHIVLRLVDKK